MNALSTPAPGSASVTVSYSDAQVEVSVKDDGRGPGAGNGGGHGLVGLRERVSVYGGELGWAARRRGYSLRATLPTTAAARRRAVAGFTVRDDRAPERHRHLLHRHRGVDHAA